MKLYNYLSLASILGSAFGAVTTVMRVNSGPTGYIVDFVFKPNSTTHPKSVLLGGFPLCSDSLHTSPSKTDGYSPWQWQPDDFGMILFADSGNSTTVAGMNMTLNAQSGDWELTVPFPSGTFNHAYYPDCSDNWFSGCGTAVVDSTNPRIEFYPGDQFVSTIQVPFDPKYQVRDYDWQLPLSNAKGRGSISFHHYPSPNSTYPLPNVHDVGIYLPNEYGTIKNKKYPVPYPSHGGGGGELVPTIVVTPNFYNLGFKMAQYATNTTVEGFDVIGLDGFFNAARESYMENLVPWVEHTFDVIAEPSSRAFAGLSLGGGLTISMLFNATTKFSSFCVMSNTPSPEPGDPQYNNTALRDVGIFLGAGFYDLAFENSRNMQSRLSEVGINYLSYYPQNDAHQWSTWQEILFLYLKHGIWQKTPYGL